jgi:integrase
METAIGAQREARRVSGRKVHNSFATPVIPVKCSCFLLVGSRASGSIHGLSRSPARPEESTSWKHVNQLKNGTASVHPLRAPELRALRRLQREQSPSPYLFTTERGGPMTTAGFRKLLARTGEASELGFPVHPHMLRHACGYRLANDGHDTRAIQHFMGHKNIQHTVRYAELASERFKNFWND